jgi:creatinine amidohydrolase
MLAEHMTWQEYKEMVKTTVFLPIGSFEQHGPHLPMNVDVIIPTNLAEGAAQKVGGMVLSPITYGYKSQPTSGGGSLFPGTTSLDGDTLTHLILDILRDTYRHGGRRFLLLNGHYENTYFATEAVDLFLREAKDAKIVLLAWWDVVSEKTVKEVWAEAGFPGWDTEHASIAETSLMMYFAPDQVRVDKIVNDQAARTPKYAIFPPPEDIVPKSGVLYKAKFSTREKGEKLATELIDTIADIVKKELG